jgi:hypothetical protein
MDVLAWAQTSSCIWSAFCRCVSALVPVISEVAAKMHMSADDEAFAVRERFSFVVRLPR